MTFKTVEVMKGWHVHRIGFSEIYKLIDAWEMNLRKERDEHLSIGPILVSLDGRLCLVVDVLVAHVDCQTNEQQYPPCYLRCTGRNLDIQIALRESDDIWFPVWAKGCCYSRANKDAHQPSSLLRENDANVR
ncbi:hypothetical protein D3C86_1672640 [compost metagenome]